MSSSGDGAPGGAAKGYSWRGAIRGNVLMIGLVSLFTDFSSDMIYPLLPMFLSGLVPAGLVAVYVGLMEGIAETTASLLKIFSGRISDRLGKRKAFVVIGYGISTVCRPLIAAAGAGWSVIALRFGDRIGKGMRTSPRDALISDSVGADARGLAFSFHRAMDHTGAILGPVAAVAILYAMLGYGLWRGSTEQATPRQMHALRWLFAIALIPGLLAMLTLIGKVREIAPRRAEPAGGEQGGGPSAFRRLPRRFYFFVAIVTLFALGNSSDLFLVLHGMKTFGLGPVQLIGLWVTLHVSKIIFSFPGGVLSDKLGRRPIIVAGWIVYALVYLGMAVVGQAWQFWALIFAYGFFYGMTEGVEKALVADFVPSEYRGTAYGIYHGAIGIAALPASLLFGLLWYYLNEIQLGLGPRVAFGVGAGLAAVAAVLLTVLLSAARGKQPTKGQAASPED